MNHKYYNILQWSVKTTGPIDKDTENAESISYAGFVIIFLNLGFFQRL